MTLEGVGVERPMLERVAWRTALLFAIVGVLWILFSDKLVAFFVTDPHEITRVQIFKGWFFVTVTSVFLYFMLRAQFRLWDREFMRANQAVRALRASEVRLRTLAEQASDGIFLCESTGRCVDANAAGCQMIGYAPDEVRGLSIPDVVAPQESEQIEPQLKRLMAGQPIKTHWHLRRKDGSIFHGEINARRLPDGRILGVVRDVTERLRLEENLRQSQKMEAVGQLAGGVAHDFNNLLTVIMGSCDLAISSLPDDHAAVRFLREVQAGGERAAALTRQLLTFSRRSSHEPRVIDLNRAVRDTEPLLRRLVGNHGTLELDLDPSALHVRADPGHVGQVLMNLVSNSKEAIKSGGTIRIRTSSLGDPLPGDESIAPAGSACRVRLSVSDDGPGIAPEARQRLFEPFYTTKPPGKGTGLGLSVVFGIVNQCEGAIVVESEPGRGTTIHIDLPKVDPMVPGSERAVAKEPIVRGNQTVLVVEDEPAVRLVAAQALRGSVAEVIEASDAVEAMRVADERGGRIDLLLTDITMPGMTGGELAERMLDRIPGLRVLYTSGFLCEMSNRKADSRTRTGFIQKPFTPEALRRKVQELLVDAEQDTA